ncbi:MAG: ATP-binding protein, partial [Pseudomonadota bacterium]|nr:ATP-binding protein [Pseudomonadota bacterium]
SDASRLDSVLSRAKMEQLDLGALLSKFGEIHESNGVNLCVDISADAPMKVLGSEDQIVQVLINLIANAKSFSPADGIITLRASPSKNSVHLTIDDEGAGIPIASLERIFERFYKERPSEEKFGSHSGLGLSISKQIIESHGGQIWAENRLSENGKILGARFNVTLPEYKRDTMRRSLTEI